eukprot:4317713-Ditylum_brightwellii.AAC.1
MVFNIENDAAGFFGAAMEQNVNNNTVTLTQTGLIDCIMTALGLDNYSNSCQSPVEVSPLGKDKDGKLGNEAFNYLSAIGMMLYLSSHSRQTFSLLYCSALVSPTIPEPLMRRRFDVDCYVDSKFAGLWNGEKPDNPDCAISRTGFVLVVCDCPIIWSSKLQKEQTSSTMEAKYVALSSAMKDPLPFQRAVLDIVKHFSLEHGDTVIQSR